MPSAANAKSEKPASSEASDNSPVRQVMTLMEHKIRNLEKKKVKLTSYRDLQKAGKELNADQRVAVAKYDEVVQTLEFARDLSKQILSISNAADRDAKKQAKRDAWVRYAGEAHKIRETLLILDCLTQMGNTEARDDFLNGTNGAVKLAEDDLRILDELYPEVTPKHEQNEEGQSAFHANTTKAAEHLYSIIDGKPKEVLGTTYTHIKSVVSSVHECGYFDKSDPPPEPEPPAEPPCEEPPAPVEPEPLVYPPPPNVFPLRPLPPITLQEVEHAYFAQQYPQQRPLAEVIGSQNFFFLQESEIDSPVGTPQPPMLQPSPPGPIPTQTFTNQHYVRVPVPDPSMLPPQPHFVPMPEMQVPYAVPVPMPGPPMLPPAEPALPPSPADKPADEWQDETRSPDGSGEHRGAQDPQRYRRYGVRRRGGPPTNGYRGRGGYGGYGRQGGERDGGYGRQGGERDGGYVRQGGERDGYHSRPRDNYQPRHKDAYYGNGDSGDRDAPAENGRDRDYGGYKSRGRGGGRSRPHYHRKPHESVE